MKSILIALILLLCGAILAACETSTPVAKVIPCPPAIPGTPVDQSEIRPSIPEYPHTENVQIRTPVPPSDSLETPAVIGGVIRITRKITDFTTSDSTQQVFGFYRDNLTRAGWTEQQGESGPTKLSFAYSAVSTIIEASDNDSCAPTPQAGLGGHSVEVNIVGTRGDATTVEVNEIILGGGY